MTIEQEIFKSYHVDKKKLISYGFELLKDIYIYSADFTDGFTANIVVDDKGNVTGKVVEKEFGDEFIQIRIDSFHGGFVGEIREKYKELLIDIRDKCFTKSTFVSDQANRIEELIYERYHEKTDFPFTQSKIEHYGVFRYHGNQKWYGLIMNIKRSLLGDSDSDEYVDIINVKIDESRRDEIFAIKGVYPSYHMSKTKWASILLDDTLSDEEVMAFVDLSRAFMVGKTSRKNNETLYFVQPVNPKYYDLDAAFIRDNGVTIWKQSRKVNIGDICYMYFANPVGAVKYKCEVVETDIPFEYKGEDVQINKVMKIKVIKKYSNNDITFKYLKSIGVPLIRGAVTISKDIADKIDLTGQ